jgi:hypothetical protein
MVAVVVVVVGVKVVLSTRKLPHKRESLLSAMTSLVVLLWDSISTAGTSSGGTR